MTGTPDLASLSQLSNASTELAAKAVPYVVSVASRRARTSGFVWRPGLVVTADEGLADAGEIEAALPDGAAVASPKRP